MRVPRSFTTCFTRPFVVGILCFVAVGSVCFGGVLFGDEQFAFRDAGHFYYPLYQRVQERWAAGRLPLWEPGENGGASLIGNPMAAVLYPGKILFAVLPYAWGMRWYVIGHVLLAFAAMVILVRSWGVSGTGAVLAGLCYAFGGPLLSNYCNVIYLVGAAWAPLGLRAADRWLRLGRRSGIAELSGVLALQVLGGDPEAAYITAVCAAGYALILGAKGSGVWSRTWTWLLTFAAVTVTWWIVGPFVIPWFRGSVGRWSHAVFAGAWALALVGLARTRPRRERTRLALGLLGLVFAGVVAAAVAAAQVLPVAEQIAASGRWAGGSPRAPYNFSVPPFRAAETIWPNVFGAIGAGNHDWLSLLPACRDHRPWALSLYVGALPLVLASIAAGFRGGPPWRAWLTAIALLCFVASLGEYTGPAVWRAGGEAVGRGDDSLYGLLATVLPGLRLFRYPGKLLVVSALSLAALAGMGWDAVCGLAARRRGAVLVTLALLGLSATALLVAIVGRDTVIARLRADGSWGDTVFGPSDPRGAVGDVMKGLTHGTVALGAVLALIVIAPRRPGPAGLAALVVLAADLTRANAGLIITVPQADFERTPNVVQAIEAAERAVPSPGPYRIHRLPSWVPIGWGEASSPERFRELIDWEIDTIQPGFGWRHGVAYLLNEESDTVRADYQRLFEPRREPVDSAKAAALGATPGERILVHPRQAFDLWGTRYLVLPSFPGNWAAENRSYAAFLDQTELIYPRFDTADSASAAREREHWRTARDVQVRRNKGAFPRAWVVHHAYVVPRPDGGNAPLGDAITARLRSHDALGNRVDLHAVAYLESNDARSLAPYVGGSRTSGEETVTVRKNEPERVELAVNLRDPGVVILADTFDPGWRLTIDGRPATVLRANLLMRGAAVTAGAHMLVYTYHPPSVRWGLWISFAGLAVLTAAAVSSRKQARETLMNG
jgi:hypothetical protein